MIIPGLFQPEMVRALLRETMAPGTGKTTTRRLRWRCPCKKGAPVHVCGHGGYAGWKESVWAKAKAGDQIYVRETLTRSGAFTQYKADGKTVRRIWPVEWKQDPRPSLHMPRNFSRLTLTVVSNKIEPIQAISDADAIAEGIMWLARPRFRMDGYGLREWGSENYCKSPIEAYRKLFIQINGQAYWDANVEVACPVFGVALRNIDAAS